MSPGLAVTAVCCVPQALHYLSDSLILNIIPSRWSLNQRISLNISVQTTLTFTRVERIMYWTGTFFFLHFTAASNSRAILFHPNPSHFPSGVVVNALITISSSGRKPWFVTFLDFFGRFPVTGLVVLNGHWEDQSRNTRLCSLPTTQRQWWKNLKNMGNSGCSKIIRKL